MRIVSNAPWRFSSRLDFCGIKQRGQVLIVILVFSAILGAALLSLYNVAQLSSTKQQLNDAADAAAYSGASVIAQGFNYTAYTNRAMLANNAMIGQMVSLRSTLAMSHWYWKNQETTWKVISALTRFIPYVGAGVSMVADNIAKFADFWGDKFIYGARRVAEYLGITGTAAIGLTNQVMWLSQQVQLAESLTTFEPVMIKVAKDNAPEASIDPVMHATAFGPLVTYGMLAYTLQPKIRKNHRTLGTPEANDDQYLQYFAESNKNGHLATYAEGRKLLPNAVGLWIATGCDSPADGAFSALFQDMSGLGGTVDTAIQAVRMIGGVLSPIANAFMCMYHRQGGSEMVQLEDGSLAWTSIDAMSFEVPLLSWIIHKDIPFAGGAVTSFVAKGETKGGKPESVAYFLDKLKGDELVSKENKKEYFGASGYEVPDCVEYLLPAWNLYAVSTTTRVDGRCAVLAGGTDSSLKGKAIWSGRLAGTADRIVDSSNSSMSDEIANMLLPGSSFDMNLQAALEQARVPIAGGEPYEAGNALPAGITDQAGSAVTGLPNTAALVSAGTTFSSGMASLGTSTGGALTGLTGALSPQNFSINSLMPMLISSIAAGDTSGGGTDGRGPGKWMRLLLKMIGADAIIDMMRLKVSDGIEAPRNERINQVLHLLNDGLPKWVWDIRVQKEKIGRSPTQEYDLIIDDNDRQDYHPRRYGLGPLVYAPLIMGTDKVRTAQKLPSGGQMMGLPDYEAAGRPGLRAIGKARVFYRQPNDHWQTRYKTIVLPNLLMPYWQARNEGLSYADKWGLLALDGVGNYLQTPGGH